MTIREMCEAVGIDRDPLGCGFVIASALRTAVQGEASTFEGECASLIKASDHFDVNTAAGIRAWLTDLGKAAEFDFPDSFWAAIARADKKRFRERWREYEARKFMEAAERIDRLIRLDAPAVVTAQALVHVMLPKLFKVVGVAACVEQVVRWLTERLCETTGICTSCKKVPADPESEYDCCKACTKQIDDMVADADDDE